VTISMDELSVGVFTPFLGNLSGLLDHAAADADARKIDPSILLNARLSPNMYNLTRQVGEAVRHAVVACAQLAGVEPPVFPDTASGIPELKERIAAAIDFMRQLPQDQINAAGKKEVVFTFPQWFRAEVYRPIASAHLQRAAVLFSRHYGLRHPAPLRRRSRQEGFSGNAKSIRQGLTRYISPVSFCATFAAALRPVISLLSCSKRCRASFWLSSTNRIAASFVIGPAITGMEVSPIVSST